MIFVKRGILNSSSGSFQLDYLIDIAFFAMLAVSFTVNSDSNYAYKIAFFAFVGLSFFKVLMRLFFDGKFKLPSIFIWYGAFTLFALSSALWAAYPANVITGMRRMIQILLVFFSMSQTYASSAGFKRCLKMFCWAGVYCAVFIFVQTPFERWFSSKLGQYATGNNVNIIGMVLSLCMVLAVYYAYYERKRIYYLFSAVEFAAIMLTGSRRSMLAAVGGIVLLVFLKDRSWRLLVRLLVIIGLVAAVFYAVMTYEPLYKVIGRRLVSMFEYASTNTGDTSIIWRKNFVGYAIDFFLESPLVGIGASNFSARLGLLTGLTTYSHNNLLEILANNGLIGFGIYYSFYVYIVARLSKIAFRLSNPFAKLMLTVMAVIIVSEFSIVIYYTVFLMAFICLAFLFICGFDDDRLSNTQEREYKI